MSEIYIAKDKFPGVVEQLMGRFRVFGPVNTGRYHEFLELKKAGDADLGFQNTRFSPKNLFHPQAERMFVYSTKDGDPEKNIMKEVEKDYSPRVILGIRPCDAKGFVLDDANFDTPTFKDPWWVRRREATTLVGLACNSAPSTCFCTALGSGPADTKGMDVLLSDVGEGYIATGVTAKGEELLKSIKGEAVPAGAKDKAAEQAKAVEVAMDKPFDVKAIADKNLLELFNTTVWDEVQFACLNCGNCTFSCPTCWCFDIQDEVQENQGDRIKLWDSCMFPLFTHHGSGHNPRSNKAQRVRQRFLHKLKYYQDKYNQGAACVGCGRCVKSCPVNIDIRQVARRMLAQNACQA